MAMYDEQLLMEGLKKVRRRMPENRQCEEKGPELLTLRLRPAMHHERKG
jgi:hypothetical protein